MMRARSIMRLLPLLMSTHLETIAESTSFRDTLPLPYPLTAWVSQEPAGKLANAGRSQVDQIKAGESLTEVELGPGFIRQDLDYDFLKAWSLQKQKLEQKTCDSPLSSISNDAVRAALAHESISGPQQISRELNLLQQRRIFIAAHLHAPQNVVSFWILEFIRLLLALRKENSQGYVDNLFVSFADTGRTTVSAAYILDLKGHLEFLRIPHHFPHFAGSAGPADDFEGGMEGIGEWASSGESVQAKARNRVLEPLHRTSVEYDHVVFFEEVFFCADAVLHMLFQTVPQKYGGMGVDAACSVDFDMNGNEEDIYSSCRFAGANQSRDMLGQPFRGSRPYAGGGAEASTAFNRNEPFQAFSCWNGLVAFNAAIFQKDRLMFRRNRERLRECSASTSELFFRDMWKVGRQKTVIMPSAASGRTPQAFLKCALKRQPRTFNQTTEISFAPAPEVVNCCPMADSSGEVKFTKCFEERWDRFGEKVPRYHLSHLRPTLQIDGDMTFLPMRSQKDDLSFDSSNKLTVVLTASFGLGIFVERLRASQETHPMIVPILLCGFSSLAMNIFNKLALSVLPLPFSIAAVQMAMASMLLLALCGGRELLQELQDNRSCFRHWGLLSLPFAGMLATSILVLEQSSVTTLMIARSALPILSLGVEWLLIPGSVGTVTVQTCFALYLVATGTLLYTVHDLKDSLSLVTAITIVAHMAFTVFYRVQQRRLLTDVDLQLSFGAINFVSNAAGLIPVLPLCILFGEHQQWFFVGPRFLGAIGADPGTLGCIALSACAGASLGYYSLVIQKQVLATSMLVLQSAVKMIAVFLAILLFQEHINWLPCLGCLLSLAGCMWYSGVFNLQDLPKQMSCSGFKIA